MMLGIIIVRYRHIIISSEILFGQELIILASLVLVVIIMREMFLVSHGSVHYIHGMPHIVVILTSLDSESLSVSIVHYCGMVGKQLWRFVNLTAILVR